MIYNVVMKKIFCQSFSFLAPTVEELKTFLRRSMRWVYKLIYHSPNNRTVLRWALATLGLIITFVSSNYSWEDWCKVEVWRSRQVNGGYASLDTLTFNFAVKVLSAAHWNYITFFFLIFPNVNWKLWRKVK